MMDEATCELVIQVLRECRIGVLDITGGAPELHPAFRTLVKAAAQLGVKVMDRCNLTIVFEPGQEGLVDFLATQRVDVVASLPCYSAKNVNQQRGDGVFDKSIAALRKLNALGYGHAQSGLMLDLVYNPLGPSLPPPQAALEEDYRRELLNQFGVTFNHLYTLANMPIQRFGSTLISKGQFGDYVRLLKENFAAANLEQLMCRDLISVDWRGDLYDCDFNQQLGLRRAEQHGAHLKDLLSRSIDGDPIIVADHCYGCTAGQGSSCGGALAS
jgi:radical SAM/Cys-rich protein